MSRILLVEGDEREAELMRGWLGSADVRHVASALDAIRAAGEGAFDVALVDARLPDAGGAEILGALRLLCPGIRVVLLTEDPSGSFALEALSRGAMDVLRKGPRLERELTACLDQGHAPASVVRIETLGPASASPGGARRPAGLG